MRPNNFLDPEAAGFKTWHKPVCEGLTPQFQFRESASSDMKKPFCRFTGTCPSRHAEQRASWRIAAKSVTCKIYSSAHLQYDPACSSSHRLFSQLVRWLPPGLPHVSPYLRPRSYALRIAAFVAIYLRHPCNMVSLYISVQMVFPLLRPP